MLSRPKPSRALSNLPLAPQQRLERRLGRAMQHTHLPRWRLPQMHARLLQCDVVCHACCNACKNDAAKETPDPCAAAGLLTLCCTSTRFSTQCLHGGMEGYGDRLVCKCATVCMGEGSGAPGLGARKANRPARRNSPGIGGKGASETQANCSTQIKGWGAGTRVTQPQEGMAGRNGSRQGGQAPGLGWQ